MKSISFLGLVFTLAITMYLGFPYMKESEYSLIIKYIDINVMTYSGYFLFLSTIKYLKGD